MPVAPLKNVASRLASCAMRLVAGAPTAAPMEPACASSLSTSWCGAGAVLVDVVLAFSSWLDFRLFGSCVRPCRVLLLCCWASYSIALFFICSDESSRAAEGGSAGCASCPAARLCCRL